LSIGSKSTNPLRAAAYSVGARFGSRCSHRQRPPASYPRRCGTRIPSAPRIGTARAAANERGEAWATDRQRALTWAQRLKRVFALEIETCQRCGGRRRGIASIEAPLVIARILEHIDVDLAALRRRQAHSGKEYRERSWLRFERRTI
jgi:hypothetical protein